MTRTKEERQVVFMLGLTDLVLYWAALSIATVSRLDTVTQVDFLLVRRDRLVCLFIFAVAAVIVGAYRVARINDRFDSVYYAVGALAAAGLSSLLLTSVVPVHLRSISRREVILGMALGAVFVATWRYYAAGMLAKFRLFNRFFYVLGSPHNCERIAREINKTPRMEARHIGIEALETKLRRRKKRSENNAPEDAIISLAAADHAQLEPVLIFCREHFRRTFLHPSLHDVLLFQNQGMTALAGIPLIEIANQQLATPYMYVKRLIDIAASVTGLILASPICIAAAVAIKATSPGKILYSQERIGREGRPFNIYKFRSMVEGIQLKNEAGHVLAKENDARITPVGHFIRKHRIDEIPQLFNVLKGDMSLIGPRPAWREYYEVNKKPLPLIEQRLAVRPGLTCLSHVLGSYFSEPADRLCYDLTYISTLSFMTDLRVFIATVRIVLSGKGAQ